MDADDGFVVAIIYPVHATTPRIPPAIIRTDNCNTMGLHSDSINRYAYKKKPAMHRTKIVIPIPFRLFMAVALAVACLQHVLIW